MRQTQQTGVMVESDVEGLLRAIGLPAKRALIPLFEAISNSLHAIEERFPHDSNLGNVDVELIGSRDLHGNHGADALAWPIHALVITDNGSGFHKENLASFQQVYSRRKFGIGGKGFGRFSFLKVFSDAQIDSVYTTDTETAEPISFSFDAGREVQIRHREHCREDQWTTVRLKGVRDGYVDHIPSDPVQLAECIIEHFLPLFALGRVPNMRVITGDETIDVNALFGESVVSRSACDTLVIAGHAFDVTYIRTGRANTVPRVILCGNGRAVMEDDLARIAPDMPERLIDEAGKPYSLRVLVSGAYLDRNLDLMRSDVLFRNEDAMPGGERLIDKAELLERLGTIISGRFRAEVDVTIELRSAQLHDLAQDMPEYRVLTHARYRDRILRRVRFRGSRSAIDAELWRELREIEAEHRAEGSRIRGLLDDGLEDSYRQGLEDYTEVENELGKSMLARYVVHRRVILDLLDRSLQRLAGDAGYALERDLHNLVFPMGKTSVDLFRDQQNLWVIDEGLSFHSILASDRRMRSIPPLNSTSNREPDIIGCFYDRAITVGPDPDDATGSVVVIEFKRPKRDDYLGTDPLRQITDRFFELREGTVTSVTGRQINGRSLRFVGYFIADLTPSLRRCLRASAHETFDGDGYYFQQANLPGYIEVISYARLLRNAQRRNRVLFEKLGLAE
jgi:hypothetical protein